MQESQKKLDYQIQFDYACDIEYEEICPEIKEILEGIVD